MAKHHGVQVGQQYVTVHSTRNPPPIWEVKSIHPGDFGISHAGLMNSDDPLVKKTVSYSALLDKNALSVGGRCGGCCLADLCRAMSAIRPIASALPAPFDNQSRSRG